MESGRLNAYRLNWVFCSFDLPTITKEDRKNASEFRKLLIKNGFSMFQFSVYGKPCPTYEHAEVVMNAIYENLPYKGNVILFRITDKQFAKMQMIFHKRKDVSKQQWKIIELF